MSATVEVLGLGNSLVDLLAHADDDYLSAQEMLKGAMNLIDEDRAEALYAARVDPRVISGGSAATVAPGVPAYTAPGASTGVLVSPVLVVDSTDIDADGVPLVTKRSRFAAERVTFEIENERAVRPPPDGR